MEGVKKSVFTFEDVLASKDNQGLMDFTKPYSGLDFWESAAEYYVKSFQGQSSYQANVGWLLLHINMLNPKSILDVGCGFGRVLPFLLDGMKEKAPETIYGVDFCQKMIQYSEEYLKDYQFKNKVKIIMADARSLPFKDNEFECVFTDSLFTHLKFTDAQQVANEIKRVASKNVITIERFVFDGEHPEPHVFSWDATKFLKLRVLEKKYIGQGLMGTVLEKKARE